MARIKIADLPKVMKMGRAESRAIMGGGGTVDTCQTPSGSPIPVPLFNKDIGTGDTNLGNDSTSGQDGSLTSTTGDEAGVMGGYVSGTGPNEVAFIALAKSTKIEGSL